MSLDENLDRVVARYEELQALVARHNTPGSKDYTEKLKEISDLQPIVESIQQLHKAQRELADTRALAEDSDSDAEMREMAEDEARQLEERIEALQHEVQMQLLPRDKDDEKNAILEVRAGTGGQEAALFAAELFRMYQRYADLQGWSVEILSWQDAEQGGAKEVSALIKGRGVFAKMKYESGVHRVQRVPQTESQGRIHTSAATVAVLPEAEDVDIEIEDKDLRIDTFRSQGAGGQHVNTTDSAVRITHLPTGVVVSCQDNKSQHKNRAQAMRVLRSRLYDAERQKVDQERADARKNQIGSGDRSERIRTYNFPQGRVTDHRIGLTIYQLEKVLSGEGLDQVIDPLISEDQSAKLAELQ